MAQIVHDYYAVLCVEETASRAEIKKAYRDLAKLHHPDKKNVANKTFGEMQQDLEGRKSEAADFRMVQQAWEVLSDAEKRTEYDLQLKYYRAEQEKIEKRQAKERRKEEKRRAKEAAAKAAQEARAAELLKREQAALRLAEIKSEEEFLQALSNDFGEDDRVCFELKAFRASMFAADPELDGHGPGSQVRGEQQRLSQQADPELEDITNQQTPQRQVKRERRHAEDFSGACDPQLGQERPSPDPRPSPSTAKLMREIERAMNMRLSDPRLSEVMDEKREFNAWADCEDPEISGHQTPVADPVI